MRKNPGKSRIESVKQKPKQAKSGQTGRESSTNRVQKEDILPKTGKKEENAFVGGLP